MRVDVATWHGRRGQVVLGPTEARVAAWLAGMTIHGLVTIRMVDLIAATHVERSEGYRITRRLRVLGLFGIQDDRGGTRGGRRMWRTIVDHDAGELDPGRRLTAVRRILGWARARRERLRAAIAAATISGSARAWTPELDPARRPGPLPGPAGSFADALRRHGAGALLDSWRAT